MHWHSIGKRSVDISPLAKAARLVVGYIHLTVSVIWFGTIFYVHIVLRPRRLTTGIPKTEGAIGWISIGVMAVTGVVLTILRYLETGIELVGESGWSANYELALDLYTEAAEAAYLCGFFRQNQVLAADG